MVRRFEPHGHAAAVDSATHPSTCRHHWQHRWHWQSFSARVSQVHMDLEHAYVAIAWPSSLISLARPAVITRVSADLVQKTFNCPCNDRLVV